ncbi:MAG: TIR domain-containing protein [Opitutus sp.]|nr:TIR domain-containing protein [Opitutus sp.]
MASTAPDSPPMPASAGAVFLSYAREDTTAAQRLAEALRSHDVEVWFDQNELRGGDTWDGKIKKQIRECALFLPVISAHTHQRSEGYFRLEWKLAVERTHLMVAGATFLIPVVLDHTPEEPGMVPEEFLRVQWTRLPGALPTPQFVEQVKRLLAAPRKPARPAKSEVQSSVSSGQSSVAGKRISEGTRIRGAGWLVGAIAALVIAAGIYFTQRPHPNATATSPSAAAQPPTDLAAKSAAKSIAVLPFTNMSDDKDASAFFSDGIHEDILTNLALIRDLRVVSRTSVMGYRGTTKKIGEVARELGVTYILEGSVRRAGNKVRVTGQLIRAATDEHLWAKSYDRDLTDIFAIQAALATEIAGALQTALSPQEKKLLERRPTENLAAYDLFLKGRDSRNREGISSSKALHKLETLFQAAVELDPGFAQAWGELSVVHGYQVLLHLDQTPARVAKATAAIDRAVSLAPESPDVIRSLASYHYYVHRDYARAIEQLEKVARLQPNDPGVYYVLGGIQRRQGRWVEAIGNLRKATRSDPGNMVAAGVLLSTLQACRRYDEATAEHRRIVEILADPLSAQLTIATTPFLARGSTREMAEFLAALPAATANSPAGVLQRKRWAAMSGSFVESRRLDRLESTADENGDQALLAAMICRAQGDGEGARTRLGNFPAELRARLEREPLNPLVWSTLGLMEAILGQKAEALRCAGKAQELMPEARDAFEGPSFSFALALVHGWTGDKDRAIAEIARLLRTAGRRYTFSSGFILRMPNIHVMRTAPEYFPLHGDPRFEALINDPKNNAPLF